MKDKDSFFSSSQRSRMLWDALIRTEYGNEGGFGVKRLLRNGTYDAVYPLHEELDVKEEKPSDRQILYENWARPMRFYKYQPISMIRNYFGEKVTIYFAWLGFYTKALIPAAIAGFICIIFGLLTLTEDTPSHDICNKRGLGNTTMCPGGRLLEGITWKLIESCLFSRVTYVFDNTATVVFAIFMSIWATMFLEGWKRKQAELAWDWDMHDADVEEEALRPEFISGVKTVKLNPITNEREPHMPLSSRMIRLTGSFAAVIFFLCLVLAFVFGIIVYRIIMIGVFHETVKFESANAIVLTAVTAAVINLLVIMILDYGYQHLAFYLTTWEFPRTEQQFEDSYTFKVFLFQFINYYSSLFYIAFFKGRFISVANAHKTRFASEACDPAGCMVELLIQLCIVMVGKQFLCNISEIALPMFCHRWRRWRAKPGKTKEGILNSRWEKDYHLNEVPEMAMFFEYLEMVLQYGFLTLFVAAFPLAPFFALINNIMEIRLDAYKFLGTYRRPMPARARDLGVWYRILDVISHLAVITNACVIAFTSDFVPRMFYRHFRSVDQSLTGYMDYSLAYFDMRPLCQQFWNSTSTVREPCGNSTHPTYFCRFREYRLSPCSLNGTAGIIFNNCDPADEYDYTGDWWHILVARLAFVLVFEHVVFLFKGIMAYVIPDMPRYILVQMQREQALAKQALYNRAFVIAGTTDNEPSSETAENNANGNAARPSLVEITKDGSTQSLARSDKFRYSPVDSADSSGDEYSKRKMKKPSRL